MDATTQRTVKRTYGKPKNVEADVPERVDTVTIAEEEEPAQSSTNLVSDGTPEEKTVSSSPLDDAGASLLRNDPPQVWDGLKKGAGANWRKLMADDSDSGNEDQDPLEGGARTDDILARARRAVLRQEEEPESSSLPPLTSTDPLALSEREKERSPTPEEETYAIKPRKRTIKASSDHTSDSSEGEPVNNTTPRHRHARTPTTLRRGTPDMDIALPSSQPEYQRLLDKAHEKSERRRARRVTTSDASPEPEAQQDEQAADEGLQTSPASPSERRVDPKRRRRKIVAPSEDEDEPSSPRKTPTTRAGPTRPRVGTTPAMDSDDSDGDDFKKTMNRMFERRQAAKEDAEVVPQPASPEEVTARTTRRGKEVQDDESDDSEDENEGRKKPRLRQLSKKDKQLMSKEAAQMRAGKEVHLARVSKQFSVAGFINASVSALSAKIPFKPISQQVSAVPALLPPRSDVQTQSSAVVPTPDSEIGQYSSQQRPVEVHREQGHETTPTKRHAAVPGKTKTRPVEPLVLGLDDSDSDSSDDDGLKAMLKLQANVDRTRDEEKRRQAFEEKQRMLKARKEAAVKAQMEAEGKPGTTTTLKVVKDVKSSFLKGISRAKPAEIDIDLSDADDDLVILEKPAVKPAASRRSNVRLNPKDALDVKREHGHGGKSRNGVLNFAPRQDVTESMFQHAGQTFDQAGKRHREGYAGKADNANGTGSHKLAPITNEQSLAYLLEQQRKQAVLERQKKERESGLKSRALQPRREQLIDEAVLEETRKAEERMMSMGADPEENTGEANDEDDSEDDDFAPEVGDDAEGEGEEGSGAENEAEGDVDMEDRVLVQETQPGAAEEEDAVMADETTPEGQEPEPLVATSVDPLEETEEALRQRKRKRAAVLDSDEEDESPRFPTAGVPSTKRVEFDSEGVPESSLISRKLSEQSEGPVMPSFGGGFDDFAGGFGETGGLSQFFGATQAPGATAAATQKSGLGKGLDALRKGTPAAGHLAFGNLGAVVSATAQDRNMAMFGANVNADPHTGYTPRPVEKQYLNSQGLFTQTTPKLNALQGQDSVMSIDDESMPFQQTAAISSEEPLLEPTYRSNHASSHQSNQDALDVTSTPAATLSRLKRRREREEDEDEEEPAPVQPDESDIDLPMEEAQDEEDVAVPSSQPEPTFRPEPAKVDVLQRMMAAARSPPKADRPRALPGMAKEFLENEAELDLEEDTFYTRLDDEDDDAEGDGVVENLVDDAARSKEQELEDARRRAEIDREYAEEEDARRQKIAQEVIEGKYKGKRRDGLDGVLSSDEEDDEDKRMAKRKWRKEQERRARELGKGLAELAHGETQAFVQAYQGGLASDDSDDEPEASQDQVPQEDGQTKDDDEAEDAPIVRNQRSIGIRDIEDQVRIMARRNREQEEAMQDQPIELDSLPMPSAFVDSDTDQEESQITISRRRDEHPPVRRGSTVDDMHKYERWAAAPDNNDSRRAGARSAVTGGTSSSRSLGRNGTSNRSGSFAITSATAGKKNDKSVRPRASAVMGGVMAKKSGFTDGP